MRPFLPLLELVDAAGLVPEASIIWVVREVRTRIVYRRVDVLRTALLALVESLVRVFLKSDVLIPLLLESVICLKIYLRFVQRHVHIVRSLLLEMLRLPSSDWLHLRSVLLLKVVILNIRPVNLSLVVAWIRLVINLNWLELNLQSAALRRLWSHHPFRGREKFLRVWAQSCKNILQICWLEVRGQAIPLDLSSWT